MDIMKLQDDLDALELAVEISNELEPIGDRTIDETAGDAATGTFAFRTGTVVVAQPLDRPAVAVKHKTVDAARKALRDLKL